jgi:cytoskeletal protein RodZ
MKKNFYYTKKPKKSSKYDQQLIMVVVFVAFGIATVISWIVIQVLP